MTEGLRSNPTPVRDKGRKVVLKRNQALERLEIVYVPRLDLKPNSYNPNVQSDHDFELLCRSMEEDGFTQPIIVDRKSNEIVDGEHRWRASAVVFGETADVPVVYVDMDEVQRRLSTLRHNRARGEEDIDLSAQLLRDLVEMGEGAWVQDSLMLGDEELNRLINDIPAPDALAGEEFSQAWVPGESSQVSPFEAGSAGGEGRRMDGMTSGAQERVREVEQRIATARNEEEKQAIRRDADVYRLSLLFTGQEGQIVKQVLGDTPAQKILAWCMEAARPAAAPAT